MTAPNVPFTPTKPVSNGAAGVVSQRARRWTDTFYDNHRHPVKFPMGRPFCGEREMRSGTEERSESAGFITSDLQQSAHFCDNPEMGQTPEERMASLASAWQAPWVPISKYMRFNYRNKRITFAYEKLIADEREGLGKYWEAAAKMAGENDVIDPDRPNAVPFRIKVALGTPMQYTDKIRLAQAAMAGDPWLLGFVTEPNVELAKLLGRKINFIGGHSSDREYTETIIPAAPAPIVTPDQVLSVPMDQVQAMIAAAIAQHEAQKRADHIAKSKAGKEAKKAGATT